MRGSPDGAALADDPLWYKDAIIYQLHVKAFYDSNGDGVGDFPGLTEKLDYLQDLGVDTLWLLPFGLAGTYLLKRLGDVTLTTWAQPLRNHKVLVQNLTIGITTALCTLLVLLYMREQQLPDFERLRRLVIRYEALSEIGAFLDAQNDLNVTVAGNDALNDLIPAVSLKGKLISYRPSDPTYSYFLSESARQSRLRDRQAIFSQVSLQDKLEIIRRYRVRYLLLREDESSSINDLLSLRPSLVLQVMRVGSYSLYSVRPQ